MLVKTDWRSSDGKVSSHEELSEEHAKWRSHKRTEIPVGRRGPCNVTSYEASRKVKRVIRATMRCEYDPDSFCVDGR